jgi:hypothetical protein
VLGRSEVIAELKYLATVEHALIVEFLFARYSVNAPPKPPQEDANSATWRIWTAADLLFRIAVDEMRHFLWANTALHGLGARKPSTGRAVTIGAKPEPGSGRRPFPDEARRYERPHDVKLAPLDQQLDWFIEIEKPSRSPSGMYVKLLESIQANHNHEFEESEQRKVVPILKLVIDEGDAHWHRLESIKESLKGIPKEQYLRSLDRTPSKAQQDDLTQCDAYYQSILVEIAKSFERGERAGRLDLEGTQKTMENLNEMALRLAAGGVGPRFTLPGAQPGHV